MAKIIFVPVTPGDTVLWDIKSKTEQGAWDKLLLAGSHMPYKTKENFYKRGYRVEKWKISGNEIEVL